MHRALPNRIEQRVAARFTTDCALHDAASSEGCAIVHWCFTSWVRRNYQRYYVYSETTRTYHTHSVVWSVKQASLETSRLVTVSENGAENKLKMRHNVQEAVEKTIGLHCISKLLWFDRPV